MRRRPATIRNSHTAHTARLRPLAFAALLLGFAPVALAQRSSVAIPAGTGLPGGSAGSAAPVRVRAAGDFARLPLSFEENRGQTDPRVKFLSRGPGYTLFLTQKEAVFAFAAQRVRTPGLRIQFHDGSRDAQLIGQSELPGKTNYFLSGDRSQWHTGIPNYRAVEYREIYPGVSAVFRGNPQRLEFDFEVAPGANPSNIALDIAGGRALRLDADGGIVLGLGKSGHDGEATLGRPVVYQETGGERHEIAGRFVLRGRHRIGFELGAYDRTAPLVIDPTLSYSTYLGGSGGTSDGQSIALDVYGDAYITGGTTSANFPTPTGTGGTGAPLSFVTKFSADGSTLIYTSFLPQGFGVSAIAVDSTGAAYLGGQDPSFIATTGAYYNGAGLTVIKLITDGSAIAYAAQLGPAFSNSNLFGLGLAVDAAGSAYLAASTNELTFPTTPGTLQSSCWNTGCTAEATVSKLSADGSSLVYSTLLGGHGGDYATGIAVDANGDAFVTGATGSTDFPVTSGALQASCSSSTGFASNPPNCNDTDAFVSELNPTGTALIYSTFLGNGVFLSNGVDGQVGIAIDSTGNAYVAGATDSNVFTNGLASGAGPINTGPTVNCGGPSILVCPGGLGVTFLAKVAVGGTELAYLGFLGGYNANPTGTQVNGPTYGDAVAVDSSGNGYLTGLTSTNFFTVTPDALQGSFQEGYPFVSGNRCAPSSGCASEGFFSIFNTSATGAASLVYSTYIGAATLNQNATQGIAVAVDHAGDAWITGSTLSSTFPTSTGALQTACSIHSTSPAYCWEYGFITKFTVAATVPAAAIVPVSGGGQSAAIGAAFANPLLVNVTDASNNPVSGATVTFSAPPSGASASLSSLTATTDSSGNASVTATANGIASGSAYQISATVAGVSTPATFSLTNTQAATAVTVTPSGLSLVYGQMVTVTASISPSSVLTTAPTGSVTFYDNAIALTPNSAVAGAAAGYTVNVPTIGSHSYAAQYLGDTNFLASALTSATSAVVVNKAAVTLTGPATQPVRVQSGQASSISVSIAAQYTGSGIAGPTGGLSYSVSGNAFGPGSLLVVNGNATIPVPATLAPGTYTVTLSYTGDLNYNAATINISLVVYTPVVIGPASLPGGTVGTPYSASLTATGGSGSGYTWTVSSGNALSGVGLTLSSAGVISGTPTGAETAASVTVQVADSLGDIATQNYLLTVNASVSGPITINDPETITVNDSNTQVQLIDVSDPETITVTDLPVITVQGTSNLALSGQVGITYGQTEIVTATVTAPGSGTPAGTVTFSMAGGATLATVNLDASGIATYTTTSLPVGNDIISAVYNGDSQLVPSAPAGFVVQVSAAGTTTLLTESASPTSGYNTTFTATVTPVTSGTPTGTVTFNDGTTAMGTGILSGGVATYATSTLPGGSDTITAVYSGDSDYVGSTSNAITPLVADFGITFTNSSPGTLLPGQSTTFTMTVTPTNGSYNEPVAFSVSGLPSGATAAFDPASLTPGSNPATAKLTITAPRLSAKSGPGRFFRNAAPTLLGLLLPFVAFRRKRRQLRSILRVVVAALTLGSLIGLIGCGASGFFNQPPKSYTVTVTGSSGAVQHSTTITMTVE